MQDAFFVYGLFAEAPRNQTKTSSPAFPFDIKAILAKGNKVEGAQFVPLIVGLVYVVAISIPLLYGVVIRTRARNDWRRKMRNGYTSGVTIINWY